MSDSKLGDSEKQDSENANSRSSDLPEMVTGAGQQSASRLGKTDEEDEAGHLLRVAQELGGANSHIAGISPETTGQF